MITASELAARTGTSIEQAQLRIERWERTVDQLSPWLPEPDGVLAFLDIGCGLGGITALVADRYPTASIHLMDGASTQPKWGGYQEDGRPWNDANIAADLIPQILGTERRIICWPTERGLKGFTNCTFDLVLSTCAWGHHFPIAPYALAVSLAMPEGATLIVDLRKGDVGQRGAAVLERYFKSERMIAEVGKKYYRTLWSRR